MNSKKFMLLLACLIFIVGLIAVGDWTAGVWVYVTIFVYSVPLVGQIFKSKIVNIYAIWFGAFIILQTLLTPWLGQNLNYKTLPPNLHHKIDHQGNAFPGLSGMQSITTDEMGFRTTKKINYSEKSEDILRIVAIGASTTEELWIDDTRTWTSLMGEKLAANTRYRELEIINTGVSGLRAIHHLETFRRSLAWKPDIALFLLGINDWNYHIHRAHGSLMYNFDTQFIELSHSLLGKFILALKHKWDYRSSKNFDGETNVEYGEFVYSQNNSLAREEVYDFRPNDTLPSYKSTLKEIALLCQETKTQCVFATQPFAYDPSASDEIKQHFWMTPPRRTYTLNLESLIHVATLYNDYLLQFSNDNNLTACDLASQIEPGLRNFYDDCHFNLEGSRRVATVLTQCIQETSLGVSATTAKQKL